MTNYSTKKGFTLVEMLIFLALYSALIVVISNIFVATMDVKLQSEATSNVQNDGNFILSRLSYDILQASSITTPTLGNTTSSLVLVINGINHTYSLSGNNLIITDGSGSNQVNSYNTRISDLSFQRLGNVNGRNSIRISFTIRSLIVNNNNQIETKNFQTTLGVR